MGISPSAENQHDCLTCTYLLLKMKGCFTDFENPEAHQP